MSLQKIVLRRLIVLLVLIVAVVSCSCLAQTQPNQPPGTENQITKTVGTLTSIAGSNMVMKTDDGREIKAVLQDGARIVRIAPGEKDLKNAVPMTVKELQVGDRILLVIKPAGGDSFLALSLVAIKQTDVAQSQARERDDWQKRGVGGIVKSKDASTGDISIAVTPSINVTVKTSKATAFSRYAPDSVRFTDAKAATFEQVNLGDQLRARGNRSPDQKELLAEQVISGSFRNIAGTVVAVDAANGTLTVKDVLAKKTVVVSVTGDSRLQKLSPVFAQRIAAVLKTSGKDAHGAAPPAAGGTGAENPAPPPDVQQIVSRAPAVTLAELQKDSAVIIVSTQGNGSDGLKAVTVLSGVEPILTAAPTTTLLAGWNLATALNDPTSQ